MPDITRDHVAHAVAAAGIDQAAFRDALSTFASGVTVLTTVDASGQKYGITASSFTSLSIDPPLVLICVARSAYSYAAFEESRHFGISVLHDGQADLATRYAVQGGAKFLDDEYAIDGRTGVPLIRAALTTLLCSTHEVMPGGDHGILIGAVEDVATHAGLPLVNYARELTTVQVGGGSRTHAFGR
ncbi:flavin reductase family protein [Prauserella muralis]|uniref:Uncharacterized protein n=1 Tax=Prauserella muralis TaxID=588067 RepID=A0A2V4AUJ3_9PSEU|nr:flavin reductase family protein [Prauserella muralis]PXY24689.1 hypothetical protein BAY60_19475 [Prauserella muralis]TWE27618.1 flavin reductase ActVB [Prauserella muralis]